jgi:apolipoprotein N-acyltransferase
VGYLDVPLPQALPTTIYARTGDAVFLVALAGLLGLAWWCARARRRSPISS